MKLAEALYPLVGDAELLQKGLDASAIHFKSTIPVFDIRSWFVIAYDTL